eukprot:TRINITY_DN22856_c0_g4_i1.p1 TRINITY_DN22856_c0_g4~~TRINITY_DN22856_c0_g4_i1.p1  ORF type:complete len:511 (+),score=181.49 TRINITY_DN22856_c0_g4_i1:46-1578(+)
MVKMVALALLLLQGATAQTGTLSALFAEQQADSTLYAAQVMTTLKGEVVWGATGAYGQRDITTQDAMRIDSEVRIGGIAELVVVAAALTVPTIREGLALEVPSKYMPSNLPARNPDNIAITYEMLMKHTSSLVDRAEYGSRLATTSCDVKLGTCSPAQGEQFVAWVESTFADSGTKQIAANLFSGAPPGSAVAYAHINTALLAYVMHRMVMDDHIKVASTSNDVAAYIYEQVIQPSGMASTFYSEVSAALPKRGNDAMSAVLMSMMYEYSQSKSITWLTHPNLPADVHLYSTPGDLIRLAAQLLDPSDASCVNDMTTLCGIGRAMRSQNGLVATTGRQNQVSQGLGVMYYDPLQICSLTIASTAFSECPLRGENKVWGFMTGGTATDVTTVSGILCTDATGVTSANRASCVAVTQGFSRGTGTLSPNDAFAMAGAAFQVAFGQTTVTSIQTDDSTNDLYGLWVGFGVVGTIVFVVAASFFTEFLIQPPPPIGPGAGFRPGQNPVAAPAGL